MTALHPHYRHPDRPHFITEFAAHVHEWPVRGETSDSRSDRHASWNRRGWKFERCATREGPDEWWERYGYYVMVRFGGPRMVAGAFMWRGPGATGGTF